MTRVMIDEKTASTLRDCKDSVLLCDPKGEVIARVVPPSPYDEIVVPFSQQELRDAEEGIEEFTVAEIFADLER